MFMHCFDNPHLKMWMNKGDCANAPTRRKDYGYQENKKHNNEAMTRRVTLEIGPFVCEKNRRYPISSRNRSEQFTLRGLLDVRCNHYINQNHSCAKNSRLHDTKYAMCYFYVFIVLVAKLLGTMWQHAESNGKGHILYT